MATGLATMVTGLATMAMDLATTATDLATMATGLATMATDLATMATGLVVKRKAADENVLRQNAKPPELPLSANGNGVVRRESELLS